jgi:hypothetical protein
MMCVSLLNLHTVAVVHCAGSADLRLRGLMFLWSICKLAVMLHSRLVLFAKGLVVLFHAGVPGVHTVPQCDRSLT